MLTFERVAAWPDEKADEVDVGMLLLRNDNFLCHPATGRPVRQSRTHAVKTKTSQCPSVKNDKNNRKYFPESKVTKVV